MNASINNGNGQILVDKEVIARCAGASAVECFGIVGMASINVKDGLAKLLKVENLSHGVNVDFDDNRVSINMHIIVSYGVNIPSVCQNLLETVKYRVEEMTGLEVITVNIFVDGIRVID